MTVPGFALSTAFWMVRKGWSSVPAALSSPVACAGNVAGSPAWKSELVLGVESPHVSGVVAAAQA
jgi:hypothetical protein